jgi:hypothetical protein
MNGKKAFVALAVITALLDFPGTSFAGSSLFGEGRHDGGFVIPCSLDGVNPAYHPNIFGNPAVARAYGFVQSQDGAWHVEKNCVRGLYHN